MPLQDKAFRFFSFVRCFTSGLSVAVFPDLFSASRRLEHYCGSQLGGVGPAGFLFPFSFNSVKCDRRNDFFPAFLVHLTQKCCFQIIIQIVISLIGIGVWGAKELKNSKATKDLPAVRPRMLLHHASPCSVCPKQSIFCSACESSTSSICTLLRQSSTSSMCALLLLLPVSVPCSSSCP